MAPRPTSPKPLLFFSILPTLLLFISLQAHARDSQFFSKVTRPNLNNLNQPQGLPNEEYIDDDSQLGFTPQMRNSGYGLYSHETAAATGDEINDPQYYSLSGNTIPENEDRQYNSQENIHRHVTRKEQGERRHSGGSSAAGVSCKNRGKNYAHQLRGPGGWGHSSGAVIHTGEEENIHNEVRRDNRRQQQHGISEEARFFEDGKYYSDVDQTEKPMSEMSKMEAGDEEYFSTDSDGETRGMAVGKNKYYFNNYGDNSGRGMTKTGGNEHFYHDEKNDNEERGMRRTTNNFNSDDSSKKMGEYGYSNRNMNNHGEVFDGFYHQYDNNGMERDGQLMYVNGRQAVAGGGSNNFNP